MNNIFDLPPLDTGWKQDLDGLRRGLDVRALIICVVAALMLSLQHYFAQYNVLAGWIKPYVPAGRIELVGSLLWCGAIVLLYMLLPMLVIKLLFKQKLSDYGWSLVGLRHHWKPYVIFFGIMLPPLLLAASTPAFQQMYPFFKYVATGWQYFLIWQLAYGLQFLAVEFFFRGFLVFGLYPRLGFYSVFVVVIPYCMIHFSKPLGESLGAIAAGIVLAYLALKNRSIWGGAALHWAVALTMDLAAILL
ncbi:MAG: CPBP family intramembrane metalloprotease [Candidatus Melainabacteria bacterium HGW-Melainabacteria-1]|nr:MAG: CPBP family intramembrane metalloprotease [Candidatus Melainabacteria bacterium HGW-Melainabacteria-1]